VLLFFYLLMYLDQPMHNIYFNNEFYVIKYCYMFQCICIVFWESYFLFAKVTKSVKLLNQ